MELHEEEEEVVCVPFILLHNQLVLFYIMIISSCWKAKEKVLQSMEVCCTHFLFRELDQVYFSFCNSFSITSLLDLHNISFSGRDGHR
mmetsp:Transcript_3330/g.7420  ORF Transcript_3330/g.7420 Transcript_3330/m.7420 type:complete len:88 (-) Transcript_3330:1331-1594(-)